MKEKKKPSPYKQRLIEWRKRREIAVNAARADAEKKKPDGSGKLACPCCGDGKLTYHVAGVHAAVVCSTPRCLQA